MKNPLEQSTMPAKSKERRLQLFALQLCLFCTALSLASLILALMNDNIRCD